MGLINQCTRFYLHVTHIFDVIFESSNFIPSMHYVISRFELRAVKWVWHFSIGPQLGSIVVVTLSNFHSCFNNFGKIGPSSSTFFSLFQRRLVFVLPASELASGLSKSFVFEHVFGIFLNLVYLESNFALTEIWTWSVEPLLKGCLALVVVLVFAGADDRADPLSHEHRQLSTVLAHHAERIHIQYINSYREFSSWLITLLYSKNYCHLTFHGKSMKLGNWFLWSFAV